MRNVEDLIRLLSDENKVVEESEERRTNLPKQTPPELSMEYLRAQIDRLKEENESLKQDREQRKIFSYVIFVFMCIYMLCAVVAVFICGLGAMHLSDAVMITLLTTTLANVIGVFNFVAKYLFRSKE